MSTVFFVVSMIAKKITCGEHIFNPQTSESSKKKLSNDVFFQFHILDDPELVAIFLSSYISIGDIRCISYRENTQ